jgi:2-isopropylmalate synthase
MRLLIPKDVGLDDNSIVLTARSSVSAALKYRLNVLGVKVDDEDKVDKIYQKFLKLADREEGSH